MPNLRHQINEKYLGYREEPTLHAIAAKVAILLLGFTLFVGGGYVASGGKGISFWLNGAPAGPADKDELKNISFTEVVDRQSIPSAGCRRHSTFWFSAACPNPG